MNRSPRKNTLSPLEADPAQIEQRLSGAGIREFPPRASQQFVEFLGLLHRWNARLNLTAIRDPEEIIQRHFVECAFVAQHLPAGIRTALDFGSGAGFPGIPIAICRPDLHVTLAESQGKKAAFLQEAVRVLGLTVEVFSGRVESMPAGRSFDVVTMRAVDKMPQALIAAAPRATRALAIMTTSPLVPAIEASAPELTWETPIRLPKSSEGVLVMGERLHRLDQSLP